MVRFQRITEENFAAVVAMKRPADEGYGTAAVRQIIRLAADSGKYDRLLLDCAPDNAIGLHLYEKLGFRPTGRIVKEGEFEMGLELTEKGSENR